MIRWSLSVTCALALGATALAQNTLQTAPQSPPATSAGSDLARSLSRAFADVYERVAPGVVVIESHPDAQDDPQAMMSPFAQFFGQDFRTIPRPPGEGGGQGSGFVITSDGYILTNNHVLEGAGSKIQVTLHDGRKLDGDIVGMDPISDLAVIKVDAPDLPVVELGDSDATRVGEFAFALGAPYDLRQTFTYGIVSAKGRTDITGNRDYEEFIQTDAAINPGNSGGPLVDIDGRVIGVNTLIRDFNRGLGFAIPINIAKKVATQLISGGRAVRAWLGISISGVEEAKALANRSPDMATFFQRFPDAPAGVLVMDIVNGTPAALSNLRVRDIILAVDGKPVTNSRELQKIIFDKEVGQEVALNVWRNGRLVDLKLRTAERTAGIMPAVNARRFPGALPEEAADEEAEAAPQRPAPTRPDPGAATQQLPRSPTGGLTVRTLDADTALAMNLPAEEGVLVTSVQPGSPAAVAGVKIGDVITSVSDKPVRTREEFNEAMQSAERGTGVMLNINRGDEKTYEILKL